MEAIQFLIGFGVIAGVILLVAPIAFGTWIDSMGEGKSIWYRIYWVYYPMVFWCLVLVAVGFLVAMLLVVSFYTLGNAILS